MYIPGSNNRAITAAADLVVTLRNPSLATAIAPIDDKNLAALQQLTNIFTNHTVVQQAITLAPSPDLPPLPRVLAPRPRVVAAQPVAPTTSPTSPRAPITSPPALRVEATHRRKDAHKHALSNDATIVHSNTTKTPSPQEPPLRLIVDSHPSPSTYATITRNLGQ